METEFGQKFADKLNVPRSRVSNVTVKHIDLRNFTTNEELRNKIVEIQMILMDQGYWNDTIEANKTMDIADGVEEEVTVHEFQVSLRLAETSTPNSESSIDSVVSMCADLIGRDKLNLNIDETLVRIVTIRETAIAEGSKLTHWCR